MYNIKPKYTLHQILVLKKEHGDKPVLQSLCGVAKQNLAQV